MKIISKKKDYYDGVQTYHDKRLIYIRKQQKFIIKNNQQLDKLNPNHVGLSLIEQTVKFKDILKLANNELEFYYSYLYGNDSFKKFSNSLVFIGFCGKLYISLCFNIECMYVENNIPQHHSYSIDDVNKLFNKYANNSEKKQYIKKKNFGNKLKAFITKLSEYPKNVKHDLFFKFKTPVFIIIPNPHDEDEFIVNPNLKQLQFMKILDPYQTYQEIEMFLSGVLGDTNSNLTTISDRDMLFKKGFNDMSFKTEKGTKKPRRSKK